MILYLIPITVALLTVTIVDWDSQCNRPLKHWTISQIIIQVLLTLNHAVILYKLPSSADTAEVVNERYEPFHYNIPTTATPPITSLHWLRHSITF